MQEHTLMIKIYYLSYPPHIPGKVRTYTKEEQIQLENDRKKRGISEFELRIHSPMEPLKTFYGFTPHYAFEKAGFRKEADFDLLSDFTERIDQKNLPTLEKHASLDATTLQNRFVSVLRGENLLKARKYVGTEELYIVQKSFIQEIFHTLAIRNIDFVVFRDYGDTPSCWDNVRFYSQGGFKLMQDAVLSEKI